MSKKGGFQVRPQPRGGPRVDQNANTDAGHQRYFQEQPSQQRPTNNPRATTRFGTPRTTKR